MTDQCPRGCGTTLRLTGVHKDQFMAMCDHCCKRAVWDETVLTWDPYFPAWKLWAGAGVAGVVLWIAGHAEVITGRPTSPSYGKADALKARFNRITQGLPSKASRVFQQFLRGPRSRI